MLGRSLEDFGCWAHSLPNVRVSVKAAWPPRGHTVSQTPRCAESQISAQQGQGLGFDTAKWIFIWRKHISLFWIQFSEPEYKVLTEPNQSWVVIKRSNPCLGKLLEETYVCFWPFPFSLVVKGAGLSRLQHKSSSDGNWQLFDHIP